MEIINPKFKKVKKSVWIIIHVNMDYFYKIERDLERYINNHGLLPGQVTCYIPTVRVLRKRLKGNTIFETLPLLFTYGFIQLPKSIVTVDNIMELKASVPAIHSFVNDPANGGRVAIASWEEVNHMYRSLVDYSVYDRADLEKLKPGNIITLKGYPFDNMDAKIISVNHETQKVKVELINQDTFVKTTEVDFDNLIWTVYHGVQDETQFKEVLFGDLKTKYHNNTNKYE